MLKITKQLSLCIPAICVHFMLFLFHFMSGVVYSRMISVEFEELYLTFYLSDFYATRPYLFRLKPYLSETQI